MLAGLLPSHLSTATTRGNKMLSFRDAIDGQMLSPVVAKAIAIQRGEHQGMDNHEIIGIIRRMDYEEDAREMFESFSEIEVFVR